MYNIYYDNYKFIIDKPSNTRKIIFNSKVYRYGKPLTSDEITAEFNKLISANHLEAGIPIEET